MATVVIADNSKLTSKMLAALVSSSGHEPVTAADGIEAIQKIYDRAPGCVLIRADLPKLSGIRAASLLRSRRGVRTVPLVLLYEGDHKPVVNEKLFDAIVPLEPDNETNLREILSECLSAEVDHEAINAAAGSMTAEKIIEIAMEHMEDLLVIEDTSRRLAGICASLMTSTDDLVRKALELLAGFVGVHIAVVLTEQWKRGMAYVYADRDVYAGDVDDFMKVCISDFSVHFGGLNLDDIRTSIYNIEDRDDYDRLRLDKKKISSYLFKNLKGADGKITGTIHLGNFTNNYYSDFITERVESFMEQLGPALDNSLMYSVEHETRNKIHHVFSKFVPEEIIKSLVQKDTDAELMVGEKRKIVVLFSDIRSFTTITETNTPEDVVNFLNSYFDLQVGIINKYGGNIDKFIGDAIFAIFGAPISYEDNVERAVKSAMEMIKALDMLDVKHMTIPGNSVKIGIGLHEGYAIVGNIGSSTKFDYTAIGDTVNLAARLEGYTKHYHREVLMSEEVSKKIAGTLFVREVDYVKVKNKDIATSLFALEFNPEIMRKEYLDGYYKAYKLYKLGNFTTALEYYMELKNTNGNDAILDIFIERCKKFIAEPPDEWDGSLALGFK